MLRAYSGTFAAVGTATGHMECADDVEHFFLERVGRSFVFDSGVRIVKHALFACAGGTYVTAGVAAYAAG